MADLLDGRLSRFLGLALVVYAAVAIVTDAPTLILVLNGLAISIAAGVCIAFTPIFSRALTERAPSRGDLLGSGIWCVSASVLGMRILSAVARDLGWPGVYNSSWMPGVIFLGIVGGVLHLWAPNAVDGRIPRTKWASTAIIAAGAIFIVFCLYSARATLPHAPAIELR